MNKLMRMLSRMKKGSEGSDGMTSQSVFSPSIHANDGLFTSESNVSPYRPGEPGIQVRHRSLDLK